MKIQPQNGDLKIYFNSNGTTRNFSVNSLSEAVYLFYKLAEGDLSMDDVEYNVIDLEVYNSEEKEWETYYNEDGLDFKEILDEVDPVAPRTFEYSIDGLRKSLDKVRS